MTCFGNCTRAIMIIIMPWQVKANNVAQQHISICVLSTTLKVTLKGLSDLRCLHAIRLHNCKLTYIYKMEFCSLKIYVMLVKKIACVLLHHLCSKYIFEIIRFIKTHFLMINH